MEGFKQSLVTNCPLFSIGNCLPSSKDDLVEPPLLQDAQAGISDPAPSSVRLLDRQRHRDLYAGLCPLQT